MVDLKQVRAFVVQEAVF